MHRLTIIDFMEAPESRPSLVHRDLYVGNIWNATGLAKDNPLGIQAVLDVSTEPAYQEHPDIEYLHVPFHDGQEIPEECFNKCMAFLDKAYKEDKVILVHCHMGVSRSPTIAASHLLRRDKAFQDRTLEQILDRFRMFRSIVGPSPDIVRSAKQHLKLWPYNGDMK